MANIVHIQKIAQIYQLNHAGTNSLKQGWHVKLRSSPTHLKLDDLGNEARGTVESYGRPIDGSDIKKGTHVFKQCVQFLMIFRFHFVIPNDLLVFNSNW